MKRIKRTTESLSKEIDQITNGRYSLLSNFVSMNTKIVIRHNSCGNTYKVTPSKFIYYGRRCPLCSKARGGIKRRKTTTQFKKEVISKYGMKYTVLGEYIKSNIKVKMRCNMCRNEFCITPNNFLKGKGCPYCGRKKAHKSETISDAEFTEKLKSIFGNKIVAIDPYVKAKTKIKFKCLICGYVWGATPDNVLHSKGCPRCAKKA